MSDLPAPDHGPLTGDATEQDLATLRKQSSIYVYEAPVRLWHWLMQEYP